MVGSYAIEHAQRLSATEIAQLQYLKQIDEAGENFSTCIEFAGSRFGDDSQSTTLDKGHKERREPCFRASCAGVHQFIEVFEAQYAGDIREFTDDLQAPFLPFAQVLHPCDEPRARGHPVDETCA